jgi:FkbM family methyltransferase
MNTREEYIIKFFDKSEGIFVNVGAYDGIIGNNTYLLEKDYNWTGICIDGNKNHYERLINNRKCKCLHAVVSDTINEEVLYYNVTGYSETLSGMDKTYDIRHKNRIFREIAERGGNINISKEKTITLNKILLENNIKIVDFLCVDTEGSELNIFKGLNFELYKPSLVMVENNFSGSDVEDYLKAKKYTKCHQIEWDDFYKREL